jgi:hypothetical protein
VIAAPVPVPPVSLAAAPARLVLPASSRAVIRVANRGGAPLDVQVSRAGLSLGREGRPAVGPRPAPRAWLFVSRTRFTIRPHAAVGLALRAGALRAARPGDHATLLLLSAVRPGRRSVGVAVRIGVVVVLRARGPVVQRLSLGRLHVVLRGGRTIMRIGVVNGGDLDEWIGSERVHVLLRRAGRVVARPTVMPRRVLARSRGVLLAAIRAPRHGRYHLDVRLARPRPRVRAARRLYRITL